ncbi:MAG: alpha-glucosidase [Oscillospiraceae bacterium]|nr:alpha-glucosidase [Oscillospiraceae bacterium]
MMERKWWHDGVIYQIYPRTFCDSTGSGCGDLQGIISKLDYIKELGVDAIWLSPVYQSPGCDNGYDISDYRAIDPLFGTMDDMQELIDKAKERGIRIIMDLVINHTSSEHDWFQRSRRREPGYEDYYIWRDEPNNWTGFFGGGTWTFDEVRGQYYLHLFDKGQPDLNWYCPWVMEEVMGILDFWLGKGIAGFRCDVINIIYKNTLEDSTKKSIVNGIEYYNSTEGCHEILRTLRRDVLDKYDAFAVGETVFVTPQQGRALCEPDRKELDQIFSFEHVEVDQIIVKWMKTKFVPEKLFRTIDKWQRSLSWNTLYFENHDQPRSVSRFGDDSPRWHNLSAKALATLLLTMRCTPYVYAGQEIGMTNFDFTSMDEVRDVESHNIYGILKKAGVPEKVRWNMIKRSSRDNGRQPMQWNGGYNAGFTSGTPWINVNKNYVNINVENQRFDPDSVLSYYKGLIALRKENDILREGTYRARVMKKNVFVYEREHDGKKVTVALNLGGGKEKVNVSGKVLIGNYPSEYFRGVLNPWQAVVVEG